MEREVESACKSAMINFNWPRYVENFSSGMRLALVRDHRLFRRKIFNRSSLRDNNTVGYHWIWNGKNFRNSRTRSIRRVTFDPTFNHQGEEGPSSRIKNDRSKTV